MMAPGRRETHAISNNCNTVLQEKMSSRDVISDKIAPVLTQMKLYGIRPEKESNRGKISF